MAKTVDKLAEEIHDLPDLEKLRLVDAILADLDKPDPEIDRVLPASARNPGASPCPQRGGERGTARR